MGSASVAFASLNAKYKNWLSTAAICFVAD